MADAYGGCDTKLRHFKLNYFQKFYSDSSKHTFWEHGKIFCCIVYIVSDTKGITNNLVVLNLVAKLFTTTMVSMKYLAQSCWYAWLRILINVVV